MFVLTESSEIVLALLKNISRHFKVLKMFFISTYTCSGTVQEHLLWNTANEEFRNCFYCSRTVQELFFFLIKNNISQGMTQNHEPQFNKISNISMTLIILDYGISN